MPAPIPLVPPVISTVAPRTSSSAMSGLPGRKKESSWPSL
jgi:hypothetical protein